MTTTEGIVPAPELPAADILIEGASHEEWLHARATGNNGKPTVGGSVIAAVKGWSPWETPYTVGMRMRGELPPLEESEAMRWGTVLEQPIAQEFSERYGIATIQANPLTIYRSKAAPFATASPDRIALDEHGAPCAWVEIKNVGRFKLDDWDEGIPDYYWAQAQWELAVSGLPMCHVVGLVGGQDLRWRRVELDPTWVADAFEEAERFLALVESGAPLPVDDTKVTKRAISARYMEKTVEPVEGGAELALAVAAYIDASEAEKAAKTAKTQAHNKVAAILREHEIGTVEGVPFVSLKAQHRGSYEVPPSDFAVLRILKGAKQ